MKALIGTLASVALTGAASAQISNLDVVSTAGTLSGGGDVVSNVLSIDFANQYSGSQILVQLDQGSIIQVANVGDTAPSNFIAGLIPDTPFDTFLANGSLRSDDQASAFSLGGGAVNIDAGEAVAVFNDATKISQAYNPAAGQFILDGTGFEVAQLTFSSDAQGSFTYFGSAGPTGAAEFFFTTEGNIQGGAPTLNIVDGAIVPVPEPATAALLGLGGLAMLRRRSA